MLTYTVIRSAGDCNNGALKFMFVRVIKTLGSTHNSCRPAIHTINMRDSRNFSLKFTASEIRK